jgi:hypothetical protein
MGLFKKSDAEKAADQAESLRETAAMDAAVSKVARAVGANRLADKTARAAAEQRAEADRIERRGR